MPIYHSQLTGERKEPDGSVTPVSPSFVLQARGPVLQVSVGLAESISQQLLERGEQLPEPVNGLALIDTGATSTCIDEKLAQRIGLPVIDKGVISSASQTNAPVNIYPALIEFIGGSIRVNAERAAGVALANQGLVVLIGRDVLSRMTMFYNGVTGEITLSV